MSCYRVAVVFLIGTASVASAQTTARHAVFVDLGNGGVLSVNLDRKLSDQVSVRVGVGTYAELDFFSDAERDAVTVPVMVSFLPGRPRHRFEAAVGFLAGRTRSKSRYDGSIHTGALFALTGTLGYRYQRADRGASCGLA